MAGPLHATVVGALLARMQTDGLSIMANVRAAYPNFDEMPPDARIECIMDVIDTPLGRLLRHNAAMHQHEDSYR